MKYINFNQDNKIRAVWQRMSSGMGHYVKRKSGDIDLCHLFNLRSQDFTLLQVPNGTEVW